MYNLFLEIIIQIFNCIDMTYIRILLVSVYQDFEIKVHIMHHLTQLSLSLVCKIAIHVSVYRVHLGV